MAFEKEITLENCLYSYAISDNIKKYTLSDTTFSQNRIGNYELTHASWKKYLILVMVSH
ncbi:Uncharacterised protein [Streptococcus pasteurianus]|nr:Uncharacterised protein [Streptococcus pasteurianus]